MTVTLLIHCGCITTLNCLLLWLFRGKILHSIIPSGKVFPMSFFGYIVYTNSKLVSRHRLFPCYWRESPEGLFLIEQANSERVPTLSCLPAQVSLYYEEDVCSSSLSLFKWNSIEVIFCGTPLHFFIILITVRVRSSSATYFFLSQNNPE